MIQTAYKTLVFDCDGVILDSNQIKTEAFNRVGLQFGSEAANELVSYHLQHGGVSRYQKFEYFWVDVLHRTYDVEKIEDVRTFIALPDKSRLIGFA
jgi:beta-phosphoglucomutase-like phosphatase (HAD superfamily)